MSLSGPISPRAADPKSMTRNGCMTGTIRCKISASCSGVGLFIAVLYQIAQVLFHRLRRLLTQRPVAVFEEVDVIGREPLRMGLD